MTRTYYVTTPIYYVNDRPHLGHMYTSTVADTLARYRRAMGDEVRFVTGTDEHGQKMERSAARKGMPEIALADEVVRNYAELYPRLGIAYDDFIRTTQPRHHRAVEEIFTRMQQRGDVYLGSYEGWYCTGCEAFYPENQIKDGRCEQGHPVEKMKEESYFFRLSAFGDRLLDLYREREAQGRPFVVPKSRMNEVRSFVQGGLNDLSISRNTIRWGVPVPRDPSHVVYVWLDALTNYISALGFGSPEHALYDRFWREAPDASVVHLIGKDILRFHAVYWPAFLLSAGLPVPMTVLTHGWWLMDETKMSKSFGNVVRPGPVLEAVGADPVRYYLLREMSFGADGTYSHAALIERLNGDLANGLGNLLSRVLTLIETECGGLVPGPGPAPASVTALAGAAREAHGRYVTAFDRSAFSEGLASVFEFVAEVNRFLVREAPWKLAKEPGRGEELRAILRACAEALRSVAVWLAPVMPAACREMHRQLGLNPEDPPGDLAAWQWDRIPAGARIVRGGALFPRADREATLARIESLSSKESSVTNDDPKAPSAPSAAGPAAPSAPSGEASSGAAHPASPPAGAPAGSAPAAAGPDAELIDIDAFMKIQLRVARVESAERVPKADKLLRLIVDLGGEKRQIVAGIAASYAPEQLVGRTIVIVANLKPAKLRGVESQGMLLAADPGSGAVVVTFDQPVAPGTRVR